MEKKDKDKLEYQIDVMAHFLNGGEVEFKSVFLDGKNSKHWIDMKEAQWNWIQLDYRKKEEQKQSVYIPFTYENRELFRGKWVKDKGIEFLITAIFTDGIIVNGMPYRYEKSFNIFSFLDNTPFGKLAEENE